ncbi:hypothetical protein [Bradyrhizobium ottawaense]|uniref:hypothetical protein n=1 Tax=Bradyrhizobium ottawaense TaxID=931866 RepID=UPI003FA057C2
MLKTSQASCCVLAAAQAPTFGPRSRTTTALDCPAKVLLLVGSTALAGISFCAAVQGRFAMPRAVFQAELPSPM